MATGGVAQPDGFFDQRAGAVVFAEQVADFVIDVDDGAADPAADPNPLDEGVVEAKAELISGAQASRGSDRVTSLCVLSLRSVSPRFLAGTRSGQRPLRRRSCAQ